MTILYSEPVLAYNWWHVLTFLLLIPGWLLTVSSVLDKHYKVAVICLIITLVCSAIFIWDCMTGSEKHETGRTRYEMILDDTYTVSELYSKYTIVEQRGQIWIIEDKEENTYDKGKSD